MQLLGAGALLLLGAAAQSKSIRGISPASADIYTPDANGMWKCLNSDVLISFDKVNDDFCDCPDGSDEPGTSACGYLETQRFYCQNNGHIPGWLPSDRVDDGICDYDICCDGSDEPAGLCPSRCKEVHAKYVQEKTKRQNLVRQGLAVKRQLISEAEDLRNAQQQRIIELDSVVSGLKRKLEAQKSELDHVVAQAEKEGKTSEDMVYPAEIQQAVNKLNSVVESIAVATNEMSVLTHERTQIDKVLTTLKEEYNPNFNDPAVKAAIKEWQTIRADSPVAIGHTPQVLGDILAEVVGELEKFRVNSNIGKESTPPTLSDAIYNSLPHTVQTWLSDLRIWMVDNALLAASPSKVNPRTGVSEAVRVAQKRVEDIENDVASNSKSIEELVADLSADYGEKDVLRAVKDKCISNDIGSYTYEMCFHGQVSQKGKDVNTNIGRFNGKVATGENGKLILHFDNGSKCWNGPIRRTTVEIECGAQNEILSVSEPQMCEYFMKAVSPVACAEEELDDIEKTVRAKEDL